MSSVSLSSLEEAEDKRAEVLQEHLEANLPAREKLI